MKTAGKFLTTGFCVFVFSFLSSGPVRAQGLSDLISAYKNADMKEAIGLGEGLVQKLPKSAEARYYLGLSYMKSGQLPLAEDHLRAAMSLAGNEEMRANCVSALTEIARQNCSAKSGASAKTSLPQSGSSVPPASSASAASSVWQRPAQSERSQTPGLSRTKIIAPAQSQSRIQTSAPVTKVKNMAVNGSSGQLKKH